MRPIHRRAVLKGMLGGGAIGVGLPLLELMLSPSGRAMADGGELPPRFGVWFWGNGVKPDRWIPGNTGAADRRYIASSSSRNPNDWATTTILQDQLTGRPLVSGPK